MRGTQRRPSDGGQRPPPSIDAGRKIDLLELAGLLKVPEKFASRYRRELVRRALRSLEKRDDCYYMTMQYNFGARGRLFARPNAIEQLLPWDPKRGDAIRMDLDKVIERVRRLEEQRRSDAARITVLERFKKNAADLIADTSALATSG